jgi:hypothetical protein
MDSRDGGVNRPQVSVVCRRKGITTASWMVLSQRCALQQNILPEDIGLLDLSGNQARGPGVKMATIYECYTCLFSWLDFVSLECFVFELAVSD